MAAVFAKWKQWVLLSLLACASAANSQTYSIDDLKVALVGQFIKNIDWPDQADNSLLIVVPQDRRMMNTLRLLQGEVLNRKTIEVQFAPRLDNIPDADLVYISKDVAGNLNNALGLIRGKGTLVVTENSQTLHNIMINIIENPDSLQSKQRLRFQINRPNILFEKLRIKPDLILHGGSELDVASLYRETERAMQSLRSQNVTTQQQLDATEQALSDQLAELTRQQQQLALMEQRYKQLQQEFGENQTQLAEQEQQLQASTQRLEQVNTDYLAAKQESDEQLAEAQKNVQKQVQVLRSLERQIAQKNVLLEEKETVLSTTSEELQQKTAVVEQQAEVIDKQYLIIISIAVTLTVFIISALVIAKLFFRNKAINQKLETTVTTLKETQTQLIESEKLASLGQLVAGVAHEINTPIGVAVTSSSVIGGDAALYLKKLEVQSLKKSELRQFLTQLVDTDHLIQSSLERCVRLIQNFKQISADQIVAENRDIQLKEYVEDIMNTQSVFLKHNNVEWQVTGDNPPQFLDPGLLSQVISNLVNNAVSHAFSNVKHPTISIDIKHHGDLDEIVFADNGNGMEEAVCERIFDPFFTTKRGDGGTGLGMNIVYNLITSKLGGTIQITSRLREGTTVTITLPAAEQAISESA